MKTPLQSPNKQAHNIFISYRRDDSAGYAGRLYDELSKHFSRSHVFIDVDAMEPGIDFADSIEQAVNSCEVLLAIIGRRWVTISDESGQRRLDNPKDFVRVEIVTALKRNIRVIPVLVQGAGVPRGEDLPEELVKLTRLQAIELSDRHWDDDVALLIRTVERAIYQRAGRGGLSGTWARTFIIWWNRQRASKIIISSCTAIVLIMFLFWNQIRPLLIPTAQTNLNRNVSEELPAQDDNAKDDLNAFYYIYDFDDPNGRGKREWRRQDKDKWIERFPNGKEAVMRVIGRTTVEGYAGTLLESVSTPDYQYFIPDRGGRTMRLKIRYKERGWTELGDMLGIK